MPESQIKVDYIHHCGDDLTVVNAARVSFDKASKWEEFWDYDENTEESFLAYRLSEKDTKLVNYLARHGHFSPFGHCFASFRVTAPIFVRSQLV